MFYLIEIYRASDDVPVRYGIAYDIREATKELNRLERECIMRGIAFAGSKIEAVYR